IDFTHVPKIGKKQQYLLVTVDQFSRWPEAFVTSREDARTVVKILATEIIP
ncbi:Retrovirus-related Pol poly from transposon opus, partial [Pelobates cultripes]